MNKNYDKLRTLLESQEKFPLKFTVKFIGKNTDLFNKSVIKFESEYSTLEKTACRESAQGAHVSYTYTYLAADVDAVIAILDRVGKIDDVQVIL